MRRGYFILLEPDNLVGTKCAVCIEQNFFYQLLFHSLTT